MTAFKSGVKNRTCNADNQLAAPGFVYDGNGSPTTYNVKLLGYDPEQRMTSFGTTQTASYDGDGLRAWKQKGALTTRTYYLYDGSTPVCEFSSTGVLTATNTFAGGSLGDLCISARLALAAICEKQNAGACLDTGRPSAGTSQSTQEGTLIVGQRNEKGFAHARAYPMRGKKSI